MTLHRGRLPTKIEIKGIRELTRDDLACLHAPREVPAVQKLRDPHHNLARLIASGLRIADAAERAGYSLARARVLHADPTFQDLVSQYRGQVNEAWAAAQDDVQKMMAANVLKAERQIAERLEKADEEGETLPVRELIAISRDGMDRIGYGKKSTQLNVNVDFAAKLERAIARSKTVIDITPEPALRRI